MYNFLLVIIKNNILTNLLADKEEGAVNTDTPEASESSTVDDENEAIEEVRE